MWGFCSGGIRTGGESEREKEGKGGGYGDKFLLNEIS
jgi:hypothetical protein